MTISKKIRTVWGGNAGFCVLIPVSSIYTGTAVSQTVPYGLIHVLDFRMTSVTNAGPKTIFRHAQLELHVSSMAAADTIREEAEDVFCRTQHFYVDSVSLECLDLDHWKVLIDLYCWESL